ncbi:hypothetical protein J3R30DRAFT_3405849 [Lentinula aciculospora]|uniref:Uncharacterized protein n=1 Tax=Lentinula aciculospora TaxID=153920 RepID=A0A9W9DKY5_9AGAR|nr:hypothetical protein J3R30DRAFT_3405849 [Lentinula aciculospora]
MSSFDSDSNNFNNTAHDSQNRRHELNQDSMSPGGMNAGGYDHNLSGRAQFDDSMSAGYDRQTPGRNQFSGGGYNDDSFGTESQTGRGYGGSTGQTGFDDRSYGDTTGTQGYGTGRDFENSRSTGAGNTASAYGTGNDFNSTSQNDESYDSEHTKPSFGDKMKGTAEVAAGKLSKNPGMVERGQERKTEGSNF